MDKLILVCVSGGKDSTVTLLKAIKEYGIDKVKGIFCDTGWEHDVTYDYINYLQKRLGIEIIWLRNKLDMIGLIRRVRNFPNIKWRFCTFDLKVLPMKIFIKNLLEQVKNLEIWFGIRKDESRRRSQINKSILRGDEHFTILNKKEKKLFGNIIIRYPILDWTKEKIFDLLNKENIIKNPLYRFTNRIGCFPCFLAIKREFEFLFKDKICGQKRIEIIKQLEDELKKQLELINQLEIMKKNL